MNFEWKQTTEQDLEQFNNWGKKDLKIQRFVDGKNLGNKILEMVGSLNFDQSPFKVKSVYSGNVLVGVCVVFINKTNKKDRNTMMIYNIVVNPELQNKGYGCAMMFDIVKNCEQIFNFKPMVIKSYVDKQNVASNKMHVNAGFELDKKLNKKLKKGKNIHYEKTLN